MLDHDEVIRLYGPWRHRTPRDAADLLRGYPGRWWVAGGWAIDAFAGSAREHGDLDIGVPREDAGAFATFVLSSLHVWAAAGSLTPILPNRGVQIPDGCGNLWLRPGGADPWEFDVPLEGVWGGTWHYERAPDVTKPIAECLWVRDGIAYLAPEIQLLLKAEHVRAKDTLDLERCLPRLGVGRRAWLAGIMRREHPAHPWLALLAPSGGSAAAGRAGRR